MVCKVAKPQPTLFLWRPLLKGLAALMTEEYLSQRADVRLTGCTIV